MRKGGNNLVIVLVVVALVLFLLGFLVGNEFFSSGEVVKSLNDGASLTTITNYNSGFCEWSYLHKPTTYLFIGDKIDKAISVMTEVDLPTLLADGVFYGENFTSSYTQLLKIGNSTIANGSSGVFIQLGLSPFSSGKLYTYKMVMSPIVDFTNPTIIGQKFNLVGEDFSVAPGTNLQKLVLLKDSQIVDLSIGGVSPGSRVVRINKEIYTLELVSATDTSANVKVTNSQGISEMKLILEGETKKIQEVLVSLDRAEESIPYNLLSARILVGAEIYELYDGAMVLHGFESDPVDGTYVRILGGINAATEISISFFAKDTQQDEIYVGGNYPNGMFNKLGLKFESYTSQKGAFIKIGHCECSDGTPSGACSGYKYCDNGVFQSDKCWICGCPSGQQCKKSGSTMKCFPTVASNSKLK